jgi:hypothetical protein
MVLASETDMLIYHPTMLRFGKSAFFTRNADNPNWRQYEMAGTSHLPQPILPVGPTNQSTADARPIFRAAFRNLTMWTHGRYRRTPPKSLHFPGSVDSNDAFVAETDADGHFAGGVRLPHVESNVYGRVAGAPLGRHTPINFVEQDPFNPFVFIAGTFTRFENVELLRRYPSRYQYVKRVIRAAYDLAARRYITDTDRNALIAAAFVEPLPCHPEDDDGNDLQGGARCPQSSRTTSR